MSYSRQAPLSPQSELQKRQVESIPAPKIRGGGIKPAKTEVSGDQKNHENDFEYYQSNKKKKKKHSTV